MKLRNIVLSFLLLTLGLPYITNSPKTLAETKTQSESANHNELLVADNLQQSRINFSLFSFHSFEFSEFSFNNLENQGWNIVVQDDFFIEFGKRVNRHSCIISVFAKPVPIELKTSTDIEVADSYREWEKKGMIEKGKGIYQLEDLALGEDNINEQKFFTMEYVTIIDEVRASNKLYLFFPESTGNDFIFGTILSDGSKEVLGTEENCTEDFYKLLASFEYVTKATEDN